MKKWRKEDDQYILDNYKELSSPKMAKYLCRSDPSVRQRLRVLGLKKRPSPSFWAKEEDEKLKQLHEKKFSVEEISKQLNRSVTSVRIRASRTFKLFRSDRHLRANFVSSTFYRRLKAAIVRGTAKAECCICGYSKHIDLHHCDGDHNNDDTANMASLCPNHHREVEAGELDNEFLFCVWYRIYQDGRCAEKMNNISLRQSTKQSIIASNTY